MLSNLIQQTYTNNCNYKITHSDSINNGKCFIFFSGHGIFYPETEEEFIKTIIVKDRYEWSTFKPTRFSKIIQVRDLKKSWYLDGINKELNSIEKVLEFLKENTDGLETICVGNSAGGYAATLFGSLLNASHIFNFSGAFDLFKTPMPWKEDSAIYKYKDLIEYTKLYNLRTIINQKKVPIYYFCPVLVEQDIIQYNLVQNIESIKNFTFSSENHGVTCLKINFPDLLDMDLIQLEKLHKQYQNRIIDDFLFSFGVSGIHKSIKHLMGSRNRYLIKNKLKKLIRQEYKDVSSITMSSRSIVK